MNQIISLTLILSILMSGTSSAWASTDFTQTDAGKRLKVYLSGFQSLKAKTKGSQNSSGEPNQDPERVLIAKIEQELNRIDEDYKITPLSSAITKSIVSSGNGGPRFSISRDVVQGAARIVQVNAGDLKNTNDALTYDEIMDNVISTYMESPEDRDAIFILLKGLRSQIVNQIRQYEEEDFWHYFFNAKSFGIPVTLPLTFILQWRYGGLSKIPRGVGTDVKALAGAANLKKGRLAEWAASRGSRTKAQRVRLNHAKTIAANLKNISATAVKNAEQKLQESIKKIQEQGFKGSVAHILQKGLQSAKSLPKDVLTFMKQIVAASLISGPINSVKWLNVKYEPVKVDPMIAMNAIQGSLILELSADIIDLKNDIRSNFASITANGKSDPFQGQIALSKLKPKMKNMGQLILSYRKELDAYESQYKHFLQFAPQYQANIPHKDPRIANATDYLNGLGQFVKERNTSRLEAAKQFFNRSKKINAQLSLIYDHVDDIKQDRGFKATDPVPGVSLAPINGQIAAMRSFLDAMDQLIAELEINAGLNSKI